MTDSAPTPSPAPFLVVSGRLTDADIERIATRFVACDLPEAEWTHAAHFAATLWLLRHDGADLSQRLPDLIRAYNVSVGGENTDNAGYHETITQASLRATAAQLAAHPADAPLSDVLAALLRTELGSSKWILQHWSGERLFSVEARRTWLEPDLAPLPF